MTATRALPQRAPSTTRLLLRRMRAAMVILTLLTGAAAGLATVQEHAVVSSAGEHTATAVMQAYAAHQALADANYQAVETIPQGAGPVGQYQDDIAAAEQSLERVAENNTAGASGTNSLQLIEGLLPAYTGLIEQADAHFRMQVTSENGVGVEDLWEATNLMTGQILNEYQSNETDSLKDLQAAEQGTLDRQQSSPWASPWLGLLWLVPAIALLLSLAGTQRLLYRRLRRILSKYLTMAAAAVIALCVVAGHVLVLEHSFRMASSPLGTVVAALKYEAATADNQVETGLTGHDTRIITLSCGACSATKKAADALVNSEIKALKAPPKQVAQEECSGMAFAECVTYNENEYTGDVDTAQAGYGVSLVLIAILTVMLLLLIPVGMSRYLDEYRHRQA